MHNLELHCPFFLFSKIRLFEEEDYSKKKIIRRRRLFEEEDYSKKKIMDALANIIDRWEEKADYLILIIEIILGLVVFTQFVVIGLIVYVVCLHRKIREHEKKEI